MRMKMKKPKTSRGFKNFTRGVKSVAKATGHVGQKILNSTPVKNTIKKVLPKLAAAGAGAAALAASGGNPLAAMAAGVAANEVTKAGVDRAYQKPKRKPKKIAAKKFA